MYRSAKTEKLNIAVVFLRYGNQKYKNAHRVFDRLLVFWGWEPRRKILVENDLSQRLEVIHAGWELIYGNNECGEFSGFDRCLNVFPEIQHDYDGVLFVTSAFLQPSTQYLRFFTSDRMISAVRSQSFMGHFDQYPQPISLMGKQSQSWVRTSCFFIPGVGLKKVKIWPLRNSQDFFSDDPASPFLSGAPICELYRGYILSWVTGEGVNGNRWHSRFELNSDNFERFKLKSLCILNEHFLTISARELGARLEGVEDFGATEPQSSNCFFFAAKQFHKKFLWKAKLGGLKILAKLDTKLTLGAKV